MTIARTLVAATIASLAAAGCSDRAVADARTRQNVIVVVLDALRADAVSALGCPRPTTPELDRFATDPDSVVFRQHHSTAS